jgi:hypothetical protein
MTIGSVTKRGLKYRKSLPYRSFLVRVPCSGMQLTTAQKPQDNKPHKRETGSRHKVTDHPDKRSRDTVPEVGMDVVEDDRSMQYIGGWESRGCQVFSRAAGC